MGEEWSTTNCCIESKSRQIDTRLVRWLNATKNVLSTFKVIRYVTKGDVLACLQELMVILRVVLTLLK